MKKLLFVCFFGVVALNACKTAKSTKKSEAETKPTVTTESVISTPVISKDTIVKKDPGPKYDLIVSFFSIGAGIDGQSVKILDDFIVNFQKDKNVIINYEANAWGREGETDYCFTLTNLSKEVAEKFTVNVKSFFSNNQLIRMSENAYFTHKRK